MYSFRKIIALLLLMIFSFSGSAFSEALKVSNLVTHYLNHNRKEGLSLVDFLKMHYQDENHTDDDDADDKGLPFMAAPAQANSAFTYQPVEVYRIQPVNINLTEPKIILEETFLNDPFVSQIWQPPRDC
ncbi:MAG: hypothetical protein EOO01_40010 [Chitinophagaceae bacterium]|nr:MAG: hypothetical protein EOO01_40010 [Chitinophagaceae bacterium]